MKRRDFIWKTSLSTAVLPSLLWSACKDNGAGKDSKAATDTKFRLEDATVSQLRKGMEDGSLTSRLITQLYLDRIDELDKNGPTLNAVIEINPDAINIAVELDEERNAGKVRGPLHGIPILIKDNIDTGDKMMTTAGSVALEGNRASADAFIVKQLRDAGAVLLGKTNLSEFANFRSTRSSSGWSSRGGQTKNPYVLDRNPCGSSSGSGTAVSANFCAIAIGTETNGSIACPSSINGVVGIKPTVGLWSRSGIIPISHTQDTAGPMARTVEDAALLLGALTGVDSLDAATSFDERKASKDYTAFLDARGLAGKRIGVEKSYLKVHEGVDALLSEALDTMKNLGAEIIEVDLMDKVKGMSSAEFNVLQFEFKDGLNKYLSKAGLQIKSLRDIIEFNKKNEDRAMPFFKQEILESSEAKGDLNSKEYREALTKILTISRNGIDNLLKEFKLDAICGPTNGPSWCTDLVNGDSFTGYGMYSPAAIAGYPSIQVPMGTVQGLPVSLTFLSSAFQEPILITVAFAYEQGSKKRVIPKFQPTFKG